MTERPILFSGPMVRAVLDGSKSQTRRICKKAGPWVKGDDWAGAVLPARESGWIAWWPGDEPREKLAEFTKKAYKTGFLCPYGTIGDYLWVRETFGFMWPDNCDDGLIYDDGHFDGRPITDQECRIVYRATEPDAMWYSEDAKNEDGSCTMWKPSLFMPRWASRITLEITDVRVQRVQEISEADAKAEGFSSVLDFSETWDVLNAVRGYAWYNSPWCWCISFRRL